MARTSSKHETKLVCGYCPIRKQWNFGLVALAKKAKVQDPTNWQPKHLKLTVPLQKQEPWPLAAVKRTHACFPCTKVCHSIAKSSADWRETRPDVPGRSHVLAPRAIWQQAPGKLVRRPPLKIRRSRPVQLIQSCLADSVQSPYRRFWHDGMSAEHPRRTPHRQRPLSFFKTADSRVLGLTQEKRLQTVAKLLLPLEGKSTFS